MNKRNNFWGGGFLISTQVRLSAQVLLIAQLKLSANLNKRKRRIFVVNPRRNFGKGFAIFVKNSLIWHFLLFFIDF